MSFLDLIIKKRDGESLSDDELRHFIKVVIGQVDKPSSDLSCQIGAMLMAIYKSGMNDRETSTLTKLMTESGKVLKWKNEWGGITVDKHSTGGVGDKVSHVLVPVLAATGLKVPMITGRSLDFTGGTLDKLESIPNFQAHLTVEEMEKCLEEVGACIVGQTKDFVPADKILYHSRDITGTVNDISLIAGSIVSKKLSEGISALVLDVKTGNAAFCATENRARELASKMVEVASLNGIKTTAFLTAMDAPIGKMIGNSLEIIETVESLSGNCPDDLKELVEVFGGELLFLTSKCTDREKGRIMVKKVMNDGTALDKFRQILVHQGVSEEVSKKLIKDPRSVLPKTTNVTPLIYKGTPGIVVGINALLLAKVGKREERKQGKLNYGVGLELLVHIGSEIKSGDVWLKFHHEGNLPQSEIKVIQSSLEVGSKVPKRKMVLDTISQIV